MQQHRRNLGNSGQILLKLFFWLCVITSFWLVISFALPSLSATGNRIISPLAGEPDIPNPLRTLFQKKPLNPEIVISEAKKILEKVAPMYSVYVYDIRTKTGFGINETTIFTAASVNKLVVLAALYHEAGQGNIDLDERITIQAQDIQDFGTGIIRYEGPGKLYSLKTLAQILMEKSDNTAAYVLTQRLGEKRIQTLVEEWSMTQTDIALNKTSNSDIANLMLKIYGNEITNAASSKEMVGFMDDSDFENRLPLKLPKTITVYHKIGTEVKVIHDAGIVVHPSRPYFIGIFTNDVINDQAAEEAIAEVSKLVYDFMDH